MPYIAARVAAIPLSLAKPFEKYQCSVAGTCAAPEGKKTGFEPVVTVRT
jgi:hypothetical protein